MFCRLASISAIGLIVWSAFVPVPHAAAERVWDNELKRYLTEQEMTHDGIIAAGDRRSLSRQ